MTDLWTLVRGMGPPDGGAMASARARQLALTKPPGSLGRLEELAVHLAGITGSPMPRVPLKAIAVMAGDHGVVEEGVSAYPQEVTGQMIHNFVKGGAAISVLSRRVGFRLVVVDMGVRGPTPTAVLNKRVGSATGNIARGPAMNRGQAEKTLEAGCEVLEGLLEEGVDVVGTGDMGIGNTTPSSAVTAILTGNPPGRVTGPGTGLGDEDLKRKVGVVERALEVNRPDPRDPLDVLAKVGGFEMGGLAGFILAAAARRIPVVIDGFITSAAALLAVALSPTARDFLIASHRSAEPGHGVALEALGLRPLLDLGLRLGEGTGAALAFPLLDAACDLLSGMATFEEAGVSRRPQ